MTQLPTTIPGWEALGYTFTVQDIMDGAAAQPSSYGFQVSAPNGADLGSVTGDIPEAASAAACSLAAADHTSTQP